MPTTVVTPSPGSISIAVTNAQRSASFYEEYLGAIRDTFDFGPEAVAFVGWPAFAVSSARRPGQPGPSPGTTSIQLWWRASDAQALYEKAVACGIRILVQQLDALGDHHQRGLGPVDRIGQGGLVGAQPGAGGDQRRGGAAVQRLPQAHPVRSPAAP